MKISVFTVTIPDLTPEETAEELRQCGYDGVEWRFTTVPESRRNEAPSFWGNNLCTFVPTEEEAKRARHLSETYGLDIPHLGSYIRVGDVAAVEHTIELAKIAGTNRIRVGTAGTGKEQGYYDGFAQTQEFLAAATELGKTQGVRIMIETHHATVIPSASATIRLIEKFDPATIGVIYDPGNMLREGFESFSSAIEILGPYLAHVHIKNGCFRRPANGGVWQPEWSPLEDGILDFDLLLRTLAKAGYDGWLGMEDFSAFRPTREALRHNINFIRAILDAL